MRTIAFLRATLGQPLRGDGFGGRVVLRGVLLGGMLLAGTACSGLGLKVQGGYASFELQGDVALGPTSGGSDLSARRIDIQDDLGLDERAGTPYVRGDLALGFARLSASGFLHDQSGSGTLSKDFGNIAANLPVDTEIDMRAAKASIIFDLINVGVVRIGPGIGASVFDIDMSVTAPGFVREEIDVLAPVPMIFVQGEVDLGPLEAVLEVGGMAMDTGDAKGTFLDVEAVLRYQAFDSVHFFGGARWIKIDGDGDVDGQRFELDMTMQGFMVGLGLKV